jgi:hypothetical protein
MHVLKDLVCSLIQIALCPLIFVWALGMFAWTFIKGGYKEVTNNSD